MTTSTAEQDDLQELLARLMVEYAGAFRSGELRGVVCRANRRVPPASSVPFEARKCTVEAVARRMLTDRIALMIAEKRKLNACA